MVCHSGCCVLAQLAPVGVTQTKGNNMSKNRTVWLLNGDKNDSNAKVIEVIEGFESERDAQAFGRKAVAERSDVIDFKTGQAY